MRTALILDARGLNAAGTHHMHLWANGNRRAKTEDSVAEAEMSWQVLNGLMANTLTIGSKITLPKRLEGYKLDAVTEAHVRVSRWRDVFSVSKIHYFGTNKGPYKVITSYHSLSTDTADSAAHVTVEDNLREFFIRVMNTYLVLAASPDFSFETFTSFTVALNIAQGEITDLDIPEVEALLLTPTSGSLLKTWNTSNYD